MSAAVAQIDFIARLAAAWDQRGDFILITAEHRALWAFAGLPPFPGVAAPPWSELTPDQRHRLTYAARRTAELGKFIETHVFR